MNQNITGVNAIAVARSGTNPSNTEVLWLDTSTSDSVYERLKAFDGVNWSLINRTPLQVLDDLKTVDGAGSGLDADTLQGFTPAQLMGGGGGGSTPPLATGQMLVGQGDSIGTAQSIGGIATVNTSGTLLYVPNSISHTGLTDIGVNTHVQIDSHISSTSNPHNVSASQVGNSTAQWNASEIDGNDSTIGTLGAGQDGMALTWDNGTSKFILAAAGGGDNMSNADLTFNAPYSADLDGKNWTVKNGINNIFNLSSDETFFLGYNAVNNNTSNPDFNVLIGKNARIGTVAGNYDDAVAIGYNAIISAQGAIAIGETTAAGIRSTNIGSNNQTPGNTSVAIGKGLQALNDFSIAIGGNSYATNRNTIAIGEDTISSADRAIGLGENNRIDASFSVGIGRNIHTQGFQYCTVLGTGIGNTAGNYLEPTANNQFVVGFASASPTILIGDTSDSYIKTTGTFSLEANTTVKGSDTSSLTTGFEVTDSSDVSLLDIRNNGDLFIGGTQGVASFTGAVTSITVKNGIITAIS